MEQTEPPTIRRSVATLTGPEIVLLWLPHLLWLGLVQACLVSTGFYAWFYGSEGLLTDPLARFRQGLWATSIAMPLQIVTALALLRFALNIPLREVGLTTRHFGRNLAMGLFFTVVFVPGTQGINWLANQAVRWGGSVAQEHPLTQLGQTGLQPIEWALLVFGAVVAVPVWEELIFRGLVQPWILARPRWGGLAALALAATLGLAAVFDAKLFELGASGVVLKLAPVWSLGILTGIFWLIDRRSADWAGLFASAVLFGWVHVGVWPSPLPLVWLALGLGWLRWRGESLVGAIVLHAMINAVACVLLVTVRP